MKTGKKSLETLSASYFRTTARVALTIKHPLQGGCIEVEDIDPRKMALLVTRMGNEVKYLNGNKDGFELRGALTQEKVIKVLLEKMEIVPWYIVSLEGAFVGDGMEMRWDESITRTIRIPWAKLVTALK